MVQGVRIIPRSGTVLASGDVAILAGDSDAKVYLTGFNFNVNAAQDAILFEYGTGSAILSRLNGTAEGVAVSQWFGNQPYELGAGSAIHIAVDGAADASATIYYHIG